LGLVLGALVVLFRAYMKEDYFYQVEKEAARDEAE